ncbi:hypothetical protein Zmor_001637 [Zophobas morio]|uniref:Uncharacterized protein n=1 Tax=Zophobas morio TaxID=2755281 RepID=A0AA38J494_9CUCU|nr:hypothetical protein Zmor_001637 [Zophobas morio]
MNEKLVEEREKKMIDIGTCNLNIIHNAFSKALQCLGSDASDLVLEVYLYFDDQPARWSDYEAIQSNNNLPKHRFVKHVTSRWLTLQAAAKRLRTVVRITSLLYNHRPKRQ